MKKSLSILLIFTLIISLFSISVSAAVPATIRVNAPVYDEISGNLSVSGTATCPDVVIEVWGPANLLTFITVSTNEQSEYTETINVGNLPAGTYTVKVANYNGGDYTTTNLVLEVTVIEQPTQDEDNSSHTPTPTQTVPAIPVIPVVPAPIVTTTVKGEATLEVKPVLDTKTGIATSNLTNEQILTTIEAVNKNGATPEVKLELKVEAIKDASSYLQQLTASLMSATSGVNKISIETPVAKVELNTNMLNKVSTNKDDVIGISMEIVKPSTLSAELITQIGTRPIIDLNVSVNGQNVKWSNVSAPVKVTIPYQPTAQELLNPESIVIWYINDAGVVQPVTNCKFDFKTNTITFKTTHFSHYAVAYVEKSFNDLTDVKWSQKAIEALAAKGVVNGISADKFNPNAAITRGDFMKMIAGALGLVGDVKDNFSDVSATATYADAVAVAKSLGVVVGDNDKFRPTDKITRQELMTISYRAINVAGITIYGGTSADLDAFKDKSQISSFAIIPVTALVKEGIVQGSNGNVNPMGNTTRAEAATIIYRIINK